jgi:N-dimethylarginine dimethylaminohydrolase
LKIQQLWWATRQSSIYWVLFRDKVRRQRSAFVLVALRCPATYFPPAKVRKVFQEIKEIITVDLKAPATMDGGDVLVHGKDIFIGLSKRTNHHAVEHARAIANTLGYTVYGVPVAVGLHLKSVLSSFSEKIILIADCAAGLYALGACARNMHQIHTEDLLLQLCRGRNEGTDWQPV